MLLHRHTVGERERERTARSALAEQHAYDWHAQAGHELEILGYGVALTSLLGFHAAECSLRVDQTNDGTIELLGLTHEARRLAITFGLRTTEVALDALLEGRALLLRDDGNGPPVDTTETGDNGLIVGKLAIPVQLEERWRKHLDVGTCRGTVHVAGNLDALPCATGLGICRKLGLGIIASATKALVHLVHARFGTLFDALDKGKAVNLVAYPLARSSAGFRRIIIFEGITLERTEQGVMVIPTPRTMECNASLEHVAQVLPLHDGIDETVLKGELRRLEALGKILLDGIADDALPGKADEGAGFGQNHVAEHGERCRDPTGGRIGEHRDVEQAGAVMAFHGACGLGHLHERGQALLHTGATRRAEDDDRQTLLGGTVEQATHLLAHDRTHRAHEKLGLHEAEGHGQITEHALAGTNGLVLAGFLAIRCDLLGIAGKLEWIDILDIGIPLLEGSLVHNELDALVGRETRKRTA